MDMLVSMRPHTKLAQYMYARYQVPLAMVVLGCTGMLAVAGVLCQQSGGVVRAWALPSPHTSSSMAYAAPGRNCESFHEWREPSVSLWTSKTAPDYLFSSPEHFVHTRYM